MFRYTTCVVEQLQLLTVPTPQCGFFLSSSVFVEVRVKLRAWQREALSKYLTNTTSDFTVTATPGAGKTNFALTVAQKLLNNNTVTRIVIVCPTDHLRLQWYEAAKEHNILLDHTAGNQRKVKQNAAGYVTTYAQVAAKPILHERRVELPHKTLVIFDEIHHAGDGLSWGEAVREAFTPAEKRLHLTGTPFRTSPHEKIPFITYKETPTSENIVADLPESVNPDDLGGKVLVSQSDYSYTYGDALNDGVVRPVIFAAYSGLSRWKNEMGEIIAAELGQNLSKKDEYVAWKNALNPRGKWVESVIKAADTRLTEIRTTTSPDAGCLILASDQDKAKAYAEVVKKVTGEKPAVVLSDDVHSSKRIEQYKNDNTKFIVAVRMVSEGVDIPRLHVLVWLTSYQTSLFFAQAVGRVIRARKPQETATVFLPTVRTLLTHASKMEQETAHISWAKRYEEFHLDNDENNNFEGELGEKRTTEFLGSEARFGHILVGGKAITTTNLPLSDNETSKNGTPRQQANTNDDLASILGLPGLLTPEQEALLLAEEELKRVKSETVNRKTKTIQEEEERNELIKEINTLVGKMARKTNTTPQNVRNKLNTIGEKGTKTNESNTTTLKQRRDWLLHNTL